MGEPKIDLWSQFTDDVPVESGALEQQPPKKTAATDGSEWSGQFDRRAQSREGVFGQVGQVSVGVGAQASNQDQISDGEQKPQE